MPDPQFKFLCEKFKPKSEVPAWLKIHDIAGLVKGAATGEGLGNAFLSHIAATDAIFHIVRTFEEVRSRGDHLFRASMHCLRVAWLELRLCVCRRPMVTQRHTLKARSIRSVISRYADREERAKPSSAPSSLISL